MKLSRESQYALKAMVYLASLPEGTVLEAHEVADGADIARPFAAKILLQLRGAELLRSHRGKQRGYELAHPAAQISVREAVEAIEGDQVFQRCVFWSHPCAEANPCLLHPVWKSVRPHIAELMGRLTVADLVSSDLEALVPALTLAGAGCR